MAAGVRGGQRATTGPSSVRPVGARHPEWVDPGRGDGWRGAQAQPRPGRRRGCTRPSLVAKSDLRRRRSSARRGPSRTPWMDALPTVVAVDGRLGRRSSTTAPGPAIDRRVAAGWRRPMASVGPKRDGRLRPSRSARSLASAAPPNRKAAVARHDHRETDRMEQPAMAAPAGRAGRPRMIPSAANRLRRREGEHQRVGHLERGQQRLVARRGQDRDLEHQHEPDQQRRRSGPPTRWPACARHGPAAHRVGHGGWTTAMAAMTHGRECSRRDQHVPRPAGSVGDEDGEGERRPQREQAARPAAGPHAAEQRASGRRHRLRGRTRPGRAASAGTLGAARSAYHRGAWPEPSPAPSPRRRPPAWCRPGARPGHLAAHRLRCRVTRRRASCVRSCWASPRRARRRPQPRGGEVPRPRRRRCCCGPRRPTCRSAPTSPWWTRAWAPSVGRSPWRRRAATTWSVPTTASCCRPRRASAASCACISSRAPSTGCRSSAPRSTAATSSRRPRRTWPWACRSSSWVRRSTRARCASSTGRSPRSIRASCARSVIYLDTLRQRQALGARRPPVRRPGPAGHGRAAVPADHRLRLGTSDLEVTWVETFGNVPTGQPLLSRTPTVGCRSRSTRARRRWTWASARTPRSSSRAGRCRPPWGRAWTRGSSPGCSSPGHGRGRSHGPARGRARICRLERARRPDGAPFERYATAIDRGQPGRARTHGGVRPGVALSR